MHGPTIAAPGVLLAVLFLGGCGSPATTSTREQVPGPEKGPSTADAQAAAERTAALKALEELESAIAAARADVASASAKAATATADRQLRLSDTRRAIVAANVALQKAREAVGREDYAAAQQATLGVSEHLKGVSAKLRD
jgi:hypothetical protein